MMEQLTRLLAALPSYGPLLLALVVGWAGSLASRRWSRMPAVWASLGAAGGWAVLAPVAWRSIIWPHSTVEFPVLAALGFVVAEIVRIRVRTRWVGFVAVCFAAWWLADSPAARPQFWRVGFGAMLLAWVLGRVGAAEARMALAAAVTVFCGLMIGGAAAIWVMALAVLVAVGVGVWFGRRDGVVPPGLTMIGLVGADIGGGRLLRGGLGTVDLACVAAIAAPLLVPGVERGLRRLGGGARVAAVLAVGIGLAGVSWVLSRALRG